MAKKTKADPTGQATNRRTAARRLSNRLTLAERRVKRMFREVPRSRRRETAIVNQAVTIYDYELTPDELAELQRRIRNILDDELLQTDLDRMPPRWWWQEVIEPPYRQGTGEEIVAFGALVAAALARGLLARGTVVPPQEVGAALRSPEYIQALNMVYVENFGTIKTLSDRTADQVIQRINAGIGAGNTPAEIAEEITGRFNVARSSAKRIANTEVNKAYNDARLRAADVAAKATGLRAGVVHISALLPTTRAHHADRHGNAYTTAQQTKWWNEGANRINCHCTTSSVLIDSQGNVVEKELQAELLAERAFFDQ